MICAQRHKEYSSTLESNGGISYKNILPYLGTKHNEISLYFFSYAANLFSMQYGINIIHNLFTESH